MDRQHPDNAGPQDQIQVPNCTSTDFKHRTRRQRSYRCASCTTEFDVPAEEELTVQVFTANYSRTWRLADRPFPESALDTAYISRSQQNAIRRLDVAQLRPVLDAHLITGAPWWSTYAREDERIPGGHGLGLSKTRLGQQRFREAMLARFGESCAFTGPQPPGALEAAHLYLYSKIPEHDTRGGLLLRLACSVRSRAPRDRPQTAGPSRLPQGLPGTRALPHLTESPCFWPPSSGRGRDTCGTTRLPHELLGPPSDYPGVPHASAHHRTPSQW